jgi:hypothetical protein
MTFTIPSLGRYKIVLAINFFYINPEKYKQHRVGSGSKENKNMINEEHIIFITKLDTIIKAGLEATNEISKEKKHELINEFVFNKIDEAIEIVRKESVKKITKKELDKRKKMLKKFAEIYIKGFIY